LRFTFGWYIRSSTAPLTGGERFRQRTKRLGVALCLRATPSRERERVVAEYWYLCRRAARRFMRRGIDPADLEQIGAIGLIKAADRFDPAQRAPFEAYAWLLVVGELMHYVRDSERVLRAPRAVREAERRWSAAERQLWSMLGREPRESDIAEKAGASPAEVREIRAYRASHRVLSFELLHGCDRPANPWAIDDLLDRMAVDEMLALLPPLECRIVRAIHLGGASVVEVARRLGYSRRHVTRLHRRALDRLKRARRDGAPE
jgi:RNA polymerase sigma factor (sigma-70 family)